MWSALHPHLPRGLEVVAESNQGGAIVRAFLHTADPNLKVKLVPAIAGKADRAAPMAMLFEAGRVSLCGRFPELEAELLGMIAGGGYEGPGRSTDRAEQWCGG
jgi:phage terminase large subunit-like protein